MEINLSKIIGQTSICPDCGKKITVKNNGVCHNYLITYPLESVIKQKLGIHYSIINQTKIGLEKYFTEMLIDKINEFQKIYNPTNPKFLLNESINEIENSVRLEITQSEKSFYCLVRLFNNEEIDINKAYKRFNEYIMENLVLNGSDFKKIISTIQNLQ